MDNIAFPLPTPTKTELPTAYKKNTANASTLPLQRSFGQVLSSSQQSTDTDDQSVSDQQNSLGQTMANDMLFAFAIAPPTAVPVDNADFPDQAMPDGQTPYPVLNMEQEIESLMSQKMPPLDLNTAEQVSPDTKSVDPAGLSAKAELQSKLTLVAKADHPIQPMILTSLGAQQSLSLEHTFLPAEVAELSPELLGKTDSIEAPSVGVVHQPITLPGKDEQIAAKQLAKTELSSSAPIQSPSVFGQFNQNDKGLSSKNDSVMYSGFAELRTTTPDGAIFETVSQSSTANHQDIIKQIVDQARLYLRPANQSTMVLQLKPEHLGEITLKVSINSGVVSATFHSENPEVRQVIEASLPQLKQDLSQQGIKLDNISVFSGTTQFFDNRHSSAQHQHQSVPIRKNTREFVQAIEAAEENTVTEGVDYRI